MTVEQVATAEEVFEKFCNAVTFKSILFLHRQLCEIANLKPTYFASFYPKLKEKLNYWKAQALWTKFDKRASHRCYSQGKACVNTRVLVIGCGPCGLRSAIEAQLLGAKVVVIEKRDRFSRHNVLHLWPFLIEDLRSLGAKKFFGKFCAGSIDHISIRQLQCILLKVALLLGVEIHENVGFEDIVEPPADQSVRIGWRAKFSPADHPVSQYEFDALISADGKRNTLQGFPRKELRGRLAIAITANFVNHHSEAENRVEEISGVAFIFNQKFFRELNQATGIDLENIVYYKDETHYFVMTAKKHSLLSKGVIIKDYGDTVRLLSADNVNRDALMDYAREAADFSTNYRLPHLDFALNHYGKPDVAMFDFTSMFAAENASRVVERRGHKLLMQIVGDSLLEPFWPTGSGCARGFLGSLDACWAIRSWSSGRMTPLEVIAERESIYRLLAQTTPENLHKDHSSYTLDPHSRYPNLNTKAVTPFQVRYLYDTDSASSSSLEQPGQPVKDVEMTGTRKRIKRSQSMVAPDALITWLRKQVCHQPDLDIRDTTASFKDGRALCAIVHRYRPDLIDFSCLDPGNGAANNQKAFDVLQELGIPPIMTGEEMVSCEAPDRLAMLSYLTQVYDLFRCEIPHVKQAKLDLEENPEDELPVPRKAARPLAGIKTNSTSIGSSKRRSESREGTLRTGSDRKGDTWRRSRNRRSTEKTLDRKYRRGASDTFHRKVLHLEAKFGGKSNPEVKDPPSEPSGAQWRLGDRQDLFARGNNKVSVMAEKLFSRPQEEAKPLARGIAKPLASFGSSSSDLCHFCKKRVYLMERLTAEGKAFHRGCFKCEYCGTMLRLGTYGFVRDDDAGGMFFCTAHLSMAYYMRAQLMKKKEDDEGQVSAKDSQTKPEVTEQQETRLQHTRVKDEERFFRAGTPERVEFENSLDKSIDKEEESEIDEEEWTDRNFGSSLVQDEGESTSEDEDEQEETNEKEQEGKIEEEDNNEDTDDDVDIDLSCSDEEFSYEDEEGQSLPESWQEEDLDEDWFEEELTDEGDLEEEEPGPTLETGEKELTGTVEVNPGDGSSNLSTDRDQSVELEAGAPGTLSKDPNVAATGHGTQTEAVVECGTPSGAMEDGMENRVQVEIEALDEAITEPCKETLEQSGIEAAGDDSTKTTTGTGTDHGTSSAPFDVTKCNAVEQTELVESCGTGSLLNDDSSNMGESEKPLAPATAEIAGVDLDREQQAGIKAAPEGSSDTYNDPVEQSGAGLNPSSFHESLNFGESDPEDVGLNPTVETRNMKVGSPEGFTAAEEEIAESDHFDEIPVALESAGPGDLKLKREELTRKSGRKYEPSPGMMRKKEVIYQERERQSDLVRQMVLSRVRTPERTLEKTPLPSSSVQDHERTRREARAKAQSMADTELGLSPPDYIESLKQKLRKKDSELEETPKTSRPRSFSEPDPLTSFEVETPVRSSIYLWAGMSPTDCDNRLEVQAPTLRRDKSPRKAKDGERRKSFIQAIADFFGVGSGTSGDELSPKKSKEVKGKSPSTPKEKTSIFKLGSGSKAKGKLKLDESDCDSRERSSSSPVSPGATSGDEADSSRNRSSSLQCTPLSNMNSTMVTPNTGEAAAMSTASRKQLKQMRQAARQAELKRLRMAQSIQRQLEEIEVKQKMLEEQGVNLEKLLRGESGGLCGKDEASLLQEWFQMVHEKNALARYEQELMVKARQLELEDRQARLQQELCQGSPSLLFKSAQKEEALRTEMKDIDEQLNLLRAQQEQQRQRYGDEEKKDLEARMLAKGFKLNSLRPRKESQI